MAPVVHPCGADAGMAQPFLNPGNVGIVFQGARGGCRAQRVRPHVFANDPKLAHVANHHFRLNPTRRQRCCNVAHPWNAHGSKQRAVRLLRVTGFL